MKKLLSSVCLLVTFFTQAQVKIGSNPNTIDANSLLELESSNKGFLPPRVAINDVTLVAPLTGTVPAGMLVYSTGGSVTNGYYYWDGTEWKRLYNGKRNLVAKTTTVTLLKSEDYVVASNDIIITLPSITNADDGLEMTVKNIGIHTDLVTVKRSGVATIDGDTIVKLTRHIAVSFIASGGNWVVNNVKKPNLHLMQVDANGSWINIKEALEFLNAHMDGPTVIELSDLTYQITSTLLIALPYSLTIRGSSYGVSNINAATGLAGSPMFRCNSDVFFKMLHFDATTLLSYGNFTGEDAIRLIGAGTYNEIKDCSFDGFNSTIVDSTNAELWVFECDIANAKANGILIHSAVAGAIVKVAETDFIGCKVGVNMSKGSAATIQLASGVYYLANATDTAIVYRPTDFTAFENISITGNSWNNTGKYIEGFDFTRSDGRDANAKLESNAGTGDKKPYCFINKLNASTAVAVTANNWTKANWGTNSSEIINKWTITNNNITFQPTNKRNGIFTITGNIKTASNNRHISICIVKNGNTALRFGETTLRTSTANQPYQFSFLSFLEDISVGDYFEIYYLCTANETLTIEDLQWLVTTQ